MRAKNLSLSGETNYDISHACGIRRGKNAAAPLLVPGGFRAFLVVGRANPINRRELTEI